MWERGVLTAYQFWLNPMVYFLNLYAESIFPSHKILAFWNAVFAVGFFMANTILYFARVQTTYYPARVLSEIIIFCSSRNGCAVLTGTITTLSYVAPFNIWTFFHPFQNYFDYLLFYIIFNTSTIKVFFVLKYERYFICGYVNLFQKTLTLYFFGSIMHIDNSKEVWRKQKWAN